MIEAIHAEGINTAAHNPPREFASQTSKPASASCIARPLPGPSNTHPALESMSACCMNTAGRGARPTRGVPSSPSPCWVCCRWQLAPGVLHAAWSTRAAATGCKGVSAGLPAGHEVVLFLPSAPLLSLHASRHAWLAGEGVEVPCGILNIRRM